MAVQFSELGSGIDKTETYHTIVEDYISHFQIGDCTVSFFLFCFLNSVHQSVLS